MVAAIEERREGRTLAGGVHGRKPVRTGARDRFVVALAAVSWLVTLGCAGASPPPRPAVGPALAGWTETGVASWYGEPFHGRRTASGDVYDMDAMTAAHPTLPFGTEILVENLDNGRSARLRVTDRGPFAKDRILDVSRAGARALGMIGPGTARVRVTVVEPGGDPVAVRGGCVVLQVAAYRDDSTARAHARSLARRGFPATVESAGDWHRVTVGPYRSAGEAERARRALAGFLRRCP